MHSTHTPYFSSSFFSSTSNFLVTLQRYARGFKMNSTRSARPNFLLIYACMCANNTRSGPWAQNKCSSTRSSLFWWEHNGRQVCEHAGAPFGAWQSLNSHTWNITRWLVCRQSVGVWCFCLCWTQTMWKLFRDLRKFKIQEIKCGRISEIIQDGIRIDSGWKYEQHIFREHIFESTKLGKTWTWI